MEKAGVEWGKRESVMPRDKKELESWVQVEELDCASVTEDECCKRVRRIVEVQWVMMTGAVRVSDIRDQTSYYHLERDCRPCGQSRNEDARVSEWIDCASTDVVETFYLGRRPEMARKYDTQSYTGLNPGLS